MEVRPYEMLVSLLYTFLCGAGMGVIYDLLRLSRAMLGYHYIRSESKVIKNRYVERFRSNKEKKRGVLFPSILFLEDLLFVIFFCIVFILTLFYGNGGVFRAAFLIAIIAGFAAYYFTIGRISVIFFEIWSVYIRATVRHVVYYLFFPIRLVARALASKIKKNIEKLIKSIENIKIKRYNKEERRKLLKLSLFGMINYKGEINVRAKKQDTKHN